MIIYDESTNLLTCLDCGKRWKSIKDIGIPLQCVQCGIRSHSYRQREFYLIGRKSKGIHVSSLVKQRIVRRKQKPYETFANVIDRLLEYPEVIMTVDYDKKQISSYTQIEISETAHAKILELKKEYKLKTCNEVIWRLMSNEGNRRENK